MRVHIQATGFAMTPALLAYTRERLAEALGRVGSHLRVLHAFLSDINGPRGGRDKRCKILLHIEGGKTVLIEDTEADLYHAIDRASKRAGQAARRRLGLLREFSRVRASGHDPAADGAVDTARPQ